MFQKVGAFFSRVAAPIKKHAVVLVSFGVAAIQTAHAALPTSATTAITDVAADGQSMFDLVFPVVATCWRCRCSTDAAATRWHSQCPRGDSGRVGTSRHSVTRQRSTHVSP